jgi:hypothetical protein
LNSPSTSSSSGSLNFPQHFVFKHKFLFIPQRDHVSQPYKTTFIFIFIFSVLESNWHNKFWAAYAINAENIFCYKTAGYHCYNTVHYNAVCM